MTEELHTYYCKDCFKKQEQIERLEQENKKLRYKIQEVVQANDRIVAECAEIMKPKCETSMISELMKENKELKEEIRFHNKENSNLLAERNAAQIGYDEIREIRERYRSALEEIKSIIINDNSILIDKKDYIEFRCGEPIAFKLQKIYNKINEVLNEKEL